MQALWCTTSLYFVNLIVNHVGNAVTASKFVPTMWSVQVDIVVGVMTRILFMCVAIDRGRFDWWGHKKREYIDDIVEIQISLLFIDQSYVVLFLWSLWAIYGLSKLAKLCIVHGLVFGGDSGFICIVGVDQSVERYTICAEISGFKTMAFESNGGVPMENWFRLISMQWCKTYMVFPGEATCIQFKKGSWTRKRRLARDGSRN